MNLIKLAINRPVSVIVITLIIVIGGLVALLQLPIQLIPDIRSPIIVVETLWPGAAPAEIEREITIPQEEKLSSIPGIQNMVSRSRSSRSEIEITFAQSTDIDKAAFLVANRLEQVEEYPDEAERPTINTAGAEDSPIAWVMIRRIEGNETPITHYGDFAEDVIKKKLERVEGVSRINVYGGTERELRVVVKPQKMAAYSIAIPELLRSLRENNISLSGGDFDEGKRTYIIRIEGELASIDKVNEIVLRLIESGDDTNKRYSRITIKDIANVEYAWKDIRATIRANGHQVLALNAIRDYGSNVIEVMQRFKTALKELNEGPLIKEKIELVQVYDETNYINSAIDLVIQNIYLGGSLAILILLLFLRSFRITMVVAVSIPVTVIGTFIAMTLLGRSINVISLAGIAFAVGMVVDATIVVVENIFRLRQKGLPPLEAALRGAKQVWPAVMVSTLTTVIVFVPILIMQLEAGQLFRDIAVAITVSIVLSLIVSVTLVPSLAQYFLSHKFNIENIIRLPVIDYIASGITKFFLGFNRRIISRPILALLLIITVSTASMVTSWYMLPKSEYFPRGDSNLVFGIILPPPGYNLKTASETAFLLEDELKPLVISDPTNPNLTIDLPPGSPPPIAVFFYVILPEMTFIGAASYEKERIRELIPLLSKYAFREAGTFGIIDQMPLFRRSITQSGRSIEISFSGPNIADLLNTAIRAFLYLDQTLPMSEGNQMRPLPGLELGAPELRVTPIPIRLKDNNISTNDFAVTVRTINGGIRVKEITHKGKRMDLTLRGPQDYAKHGQDINNMPIVTPQGNIVPLSSLADVEFVGSPTEIRREEQERTITLLVTPREDIILEEAIDMIKQNVIAPITQEGIPEDVNISLGGTVDDLTKTLDEMSEGMIIAVVIVFLIMVMLFENFLYPLVIMLAVPVSLIGGILGLAVLNMFIFNPLDVITMLGFIILIGIVVNNSILLVYKSLDNYYENKDASKSVQDALATRIRPIFMSTLTSLFGMMPLVVFPQDGSELYRGLGSIVLGGLALSATVVLILVPPATFLCIKLQENIRKII